MKRIFITSIIAAVFVLLPTSVPGAQPSNDTSKLFIEGENFYNAGVYNSAFNCFYKAASQGHARSQVYLAFMYANGMGVPKNEAMAIEYWKMAAKQGDAIAQNNLTSRGISDWNSSAPAQAPVIQSAKSLSDTAKLFSEGENFYNANAYDSAFNRFSRAASQGHTRAQVYLAFMYANGLGIPKDEAMAIEYWKMAARQGDAIAQNNLTSRGISDWGSAANVQMPPPPQAPAPQKPLPKTPTVQAARPSDDAQKLYNEGVSFYNAQNYSSALNRFTRAAELGHVIALFYIGIMYEKGDGVNRNFKHALELYHKAAEQGYAVAQYDLGVIYSIGDGVTQDDNRAVYWYNKSADQGYPLAQNNLGIMYEAGRGVPKNEAMAIEFYRMAAEQGEENARKNLLRLGVDN